MRLNKEIIDKSACGMDVFERYGWFTNVISELAFATQLGSNTLKEIVERELKLFKVYHKEDSVFEDDNDTYTFQAVWQVEMEIALNWLAWEWSGIDTERSMALQKAWQKVRVANCTSYKNEEFAHLHFHMTD